MRTARERRPSRSSWHSGCSSCDQFPAALPYLRNTEDEGLARIARPLPETAKDLALLADEVDQESKKSKYSRRQEEALRAYARFLRQTALDKNDSSLQPAERVEVQNKLSAAETQRNESNNPEGQDSATLKVVVSGRKPSL